MRQVSAAPTRPCPGFQAALACLLLAVLPAGGARSQAPPELAGADGQKLAAPAQSSKKHRRRQKRPIELGTSGGGFENFTVIPPDVACCGGTLGALLEKEGRYFILSNNHVIARFNQAALGEAIGQPGLFDTNCKAPDRNLIGNLSDFKRLKLNGTNKVDAAIAETSVDNVSADGAILGLGVPGNKVVNPKVGDAVTKSGRSTGVTRSEVSAMNVTGDVRFPVECGSDSERDVRFKKVFLVDGGDFSAGGDSGSVIYEDAANCPRAMGLLFAGSATFTAANPMSQIMKAVKKMRPKGRAKLVGCDPVAVFGEPRRARRSDRAESFAMDVQRSNEDGVLAIPGVVAIGIGRAPKETGEVVFKVLVEDSRPEIVDAIPESIEGVPVEVVVSGGFRALHCPSDQPSGPAIGGLATTGPS
ncbi:MAG: hypothetical protein GY769_21925 [bacterium]|nr:hypothetical protein [bacterium]